MQGQGINSLIPPKRETSDTADSGQRTNDNGQRTNDNGQWTNDNGQWTNDNGQWTNDNGQRTTDSGQMTADSGHLTNDMRQEIGDEGVSEVSKVSEVSEVSEETNIDMPVNFSGEVFDREKPRYGSIGRMKPKEFNAIFQLEVAQIKPNPYQPRKYFNDEELRELGESIREYGVIQPIIVSKIEKETPYGTEIEYQLIAGERRLMASKLIGLPRIPAIIKHINSNKMKLELALIENIQRSNLNPLETAKAYSKLQDEFALTQREIATRVGKSREVVANTLRLLNLPSYAQEALSAGKINESQARMLLTIVNVEDQKATLAKIINQKLSVRALKENIATAPAVQINPEQAYWEKQLAEKFGVPVKLIKEGDKGKMVIQFFSDEGMRDLLNKLLGEAARD